MTDEVQPKKTLTQTIWIVLGFALFALLVSRDCTGGVTQASKEATHRDLEKRVAEINAKCPVKADPETELTDVALGSNNEIYYHYKLLSHKSSETNKEAFEKLYKQQMTIQYKTRDDLKSFRENQIVFVYLFSGSDGVEICKFSVSPRDL
jgi:hypothetical protein